MKRCPKHKWERRGRSTTSGDLTSPPKYSKKFKVYETCATCGKTRIRHMTNFEFLSFQKKDKTRAKDTKNLHKIFHSFLSEILDDDKKFKEEGLFRFKDVEDFAEKMKDVKLTYCDDDFFTTSELLWVPHVSGNTFMGVSLIFIPQVTADKPTTIFLYPNHLKQLIHAANFYDEMYHKTRGYLH